MIRRVRKGDREYVLGYCSETFGWGDYIGEVWDDWMSEGLFLAYVDCAVSPSRQPRGGHTAASPPALSMRRTAESRAGPAPRPRARFKGAPPDTRDVLHDAPPVGVCHAHISAGQVWIEGIRVHPEYRRRGIASALVGEAERLALGEYDLWGDRADADADAGADAAPTTGDVAPRRAPVSRMLVDVSNKPSLAMTKLMGYLPTHTWAYYSLQPRRSDRDIFGTGDGSKKGAAATGPEPSAALLDPSVCSHYVRSWRWFETDYTTLRRIASEGMAAVLPAPVSDSRCGSGPGHPGCAAAPAAAPTAAIMSVSESVTTRGRLEMYATLYPGSSTRHVAMMIEHIADVAARRGCGHASLFSQDGGLPACEGLARRLAFVLIEKTAGPS